MTCSDAGHACIDMYCSYISSQNLYFKLFVAKNDQLHWGFIYLLFLKNFFPLAAEQIWVG